MATATHSTPADASGQPPAQDSYKSYESKIYGRDPSTVERNSILFTVRSRVGALDDCLAVFRRHSLNLTKIESRTSKTVADAYDFFVDVDRGADAIPACVDELRGICSSVQTLGSRGEVQWFPRKPADFDELSRRVVDYGDDLAPDHPGYADAEYRRRRKEFGLLALQYRHGTEIPRVAYTPSEIATWGQVFRNLKRLYPTHACRQFNAVFPLLEQFCGYTEQNIPQLADISRFLKETTGWTLRPVAGLLTARDFLNSMAFRIFHSTQYIRHASRPLYTPEPDVCHELLGHVPLFADPAFADFSQQLGLASLGASDEHLKALGTLYWWTVEFGVCREADGLRAYGAGLLSSYGELEWSLSDKPQHLPFDPAVTAAQSYQITEYQPMYFVTESFDDATARLREFAARLPRPFVLRHNPLTDCIDVLDSRQKLLQFMDQLQGDLACATAAVRKLPFE